MKRVIFILFILTPVLSVDGAKAFDPSGMDMDRLMFHATRYGTTPEKRERKAAARDELMGRGTVALRYLVGNTGIENMWFWIYARQMVEQMPGEQAMPVLLDALQSPDVQVRKAAIYFMGEYETPEHADRIMPMLDHEKTAGVTLRTLGKWGVKSAVPMIIPFLQSTNERKRVAAANALRDIGDPRAVQPLMEVLDDPVFTVRNTAARALVSLGDRSRQAVLESLPNAGPVSRRQMIRMLCDLRIDDVETVLVPWLKHRDWGVRGDAFRALKAIAPEKAARDPLGSTHPYARFLLVLP
jgi:HEAT repeat protein